MSDMVYPVDFASH